MNQFLKQLKKASAIVKLTEKEKESGRQLLRAQIVQGTHTHTRHVRRFFPRFALSFAIAVVCIGTFSYAAEQSVPGQVLYAVKTRVNEKIRNFLPKSTEQDMEWEVTKQERRNAELSRIAGELGI